MTAETTYIVLRRGAQKSESQDWAWTVENSNVPATSADAAIRLACKNDNAPAGMYVAVPHRSWKPVTVKAVQTTVLKLEEATTPSPAEPKAMEPHERCNAAIIYIYNWRCSRRATRDGLCAQHHKLGCNVPTRWQHAENEWGVTVPNPIGAWRRIPPTPASPS